MDTVKIKGQKISQGEKFTDEGWRTPITRILIKPGKGEIKPEESLKVGDKVKVIGTSKGKGFAGVVKRWHFAGGPRTHGQSDRERAPGSIGQTTTPGRVYKGKKMGGRLGGTKTTVKGLKVVEMKEAEKILVVEGLVPGAKKSLLTIIRE